MSTATEARAEWLDWRRTGIGASDIAALLGISRWSSPFAVWADKLGLLPDEDLDDDDPREFGRRAEAMVAPWFRDRTGLELAGEQMWLTHRDQPWLKATPDALVTEHPPRPMYHYSGTSTSGYHLEKVETEPVDPWSALGPLEIKTDMGRPWPTIPEDYQAQGQHQMLVGGWDRCWFAVLHGRRFRVYELERDQADCDLIERTAREFWHEHVLTGTPPPVDESEATQAAIAAIYPDTVKGKVVDLEQIAGAFTMLAEAKADRKDAEQREEAASNVIRWAMKDAAEGRLFGRKACTLTTQTRKTTCRHCGAVDVSDPFRVLRPAKEFQ